MKASEILFEYANNKPLIVIDVQPAFSNSIYFEESLAEYINKRTGNTLMIYAGSDVTNDDEMAVKWWWHENGMTEEAISKLQWVEKEWGYFRSWMDNGIPEDTIIKVIREMYNQKVSDTRDLFNSNLDDLISFIGDEWQPFMEDDHMSVQWIDVALLKKYSGCYLCGGVEHECLREVTLLMDAFNIKYTLLREFIF